MAFINSCIKAIKDTLDQSLSSYIVPPMSDCSAMATKSTASRTKLQMGGVRSDASLAVSREPQPFKYPTPPQLSLATTLHDFDDQLSEKVTMHDPSANDYEEDSDSRQKRHEQEVARHVRQQAMDMVLFKTFVGGAAVPHFG